jgi:DNA-binding NarL/FixJ family response regulator
MLVSQSTLAPAPGASHPRLSPAVTLVLVAARDEEQVLHHALQTLERERQAFRTASTLAEGCQRLLNEPIDLVLIDVRFPSEAILGAIFRFRRIAPSVRIVVYAKEQGLSTCIDAVPISKPETALASIGQPDGSHGSAGVHRIDVSSLQTLRGNGPPTPVSVLPLSDRQLAILKHLAEGLSVKEIASKLRVSYKSVDSLKYRMMRRLRIHDRVDLTRFAIREGLIAP